MNRQATPLSIHPPRAATTILMLLLAALPLATYPDAATGSATGSDSTEMNELLPGRAESIRVPLRTETAAQPRDDAPNDRVLPSRGTQGPGVFRVQLPGEERESNPA